MKIYYLYENKVSIGPFSIEELKDRKINSFTPIWCEGFETWKTAGEIEALQSIVNELPTPIEINTEEKHIYKKINSRFLGFYRKNMMAIIMVMVLVLVSLLIMNYKSNKIIDLEKTNKEIQKENYTKKIEEQQQKLEEQTKILTEKEQQEKARLNSSRRKADEETYKDILTAISNAYDELEEAKEELESAKGYRLFRSAKKKEQQINEAEYAIEICKRKIELLKLEKRQMEINLTY